MGLFAAFLGAFFSSSRDLVSKSVSCSVDGMVSAFASFLFALPYYVVLLTALYAFGFETFSISIAFLWLVVLRSSTDALAESFKMYALSHGDISVVSCFLSLSPIFLLVFSPIITGDPITLHGVVAILLVVAGSILVAYKKRGNPREAIRFKGIVFGICASLFFALCSCFDRLAVKESSPVFSGFSMTLLAALLLMPLVVRRKDRLRELSDHAKPFWLRGFFEIAYMVSKLCALVYLQAPYVVAIGSSAMLFSILGGRVFFKEKQFLRRMTAGLLILAGVLVIVIEQVDLFRH